MSEKFGKLLKKHRAENGYTIKQLLEALEDNECEIYSPGTVSKWENGKNQPKPTVIMVLEDILGLSRGVLLRAAGYDETETYEEEAIQVDPVISKQKANHFEYLAEITSWILANDLDDVGPNLLQGQGEPFDEFEYMVGTSSDGYGIADDQELSFRLERNMEFISDKYIKFDLDCLESHLKAESSEIASKRFYGTLWEKPYELIEKLRVISRRKTLKGTCPVCEDWE